VTVDPKMSVTSAEQAHDLEKAFDDMFGETDKSEPPKTEATPVTTEEPPAETEPELEPEATEEGKPEPEKSDPEPKEEPATDPDDEPDEELDSFKVHVNSTPETIDQFRSLRGKAKQFKKRLTEAQSKLEAQIGELTNLKGTQRPVSDPTVQKELEDLRTFRQKHEIFDDSTFQNQYEMPVRSQFDEIINDVKAMAPDKAAADAWEAEVRKLGPDRINKAYWNEGVIAQVADPLDRDRMIRKVSSLLELQNKRNQFAAEIAEKPDRYQEYQHEQAANYWKNFGVEAEDETSKLVTQMGDWAVRKDPVTAKTQVEREAIERHNKAYEVYETHFKNYITDAATQGPRGMARTAAAAVQGLKYKHDLDRSATELKKVKLELQKAKEELNKIAGARSRVAQSSGAQPNGNKPGADTGPKKAGKSLDSAFRDFFGST
jgi:hypothetical protein